MIATCASNPVPSAIVTLVAFAPVLKIASCPLTFAAETPAFDKLDTLLIAVTTASTSVPLTATLSPSTVNVFEVVIVVIAPPVTLGTVPVQVVVPTLAQLPK
mgnify:CR=1 FL=1